MSDKKMQRIYIRVTEEEKKRWQEKAENAGLPLSTLIRQSMEKTRTWTVEDRKIKQEKIRQIARIGNNLNQIARWANTYKREAQAVDILEALILIDEDLKKCW